MPIFKDDGYEFKQSEELTAKRKKTFWLLAMFQFMCCAAIIIAFFFKASFLFSFIIFPFFLLLHITYMKGINSLKDEGVNPGALQTVRFILLAFFLVCFGFGMLTASM